MDDSLLIWFVQVQVIEWQNRRRHFAYGQLHNVYVYVSDVGDDFVGKTVSTEPSSVRQIPFLSSTECSDLILVFFVCKMHICFSTWRGPVDVDESHRGPNKIGQTSESISLMLFRFLLF